MYVPYAFEPAYDLLAWRTMDPPTEWHWEEATGDEASTMLEKSHVMRTIFESGYGGFVSQRQVIVSYKCNICGKEFTDQIISKMALAGLEHISTDHPEHYAMAVLKEDE